MKAEPLVIVTVSRRRVWYVAALVLAIGVFVAYLWFDAAQDWEGFFASRNSRLRIPIISLLWLAMLVIALKWARQLLSHDGRTVWIEDGRLIFFYPSYFSEPLSNISALSLTSDFFGWDQIRISLRHGAERKFHITRMPVQPDVLVKRLREICGLPEEEVERSGE